MGMGIGECECPYCKSENSIDEHIGEDESREMECLYCDRAFVVSAHITVTYSSMCIDSDHDFITGRFPDGMKYKECSRCGELQVIHDEPIDNDDPVED